MVETPYEVMPCPKCGSDHLITEIMQSQDVYLEDGVTDYIEPRGQPEIHEVWCTKCDEKVWERGEE